VTEARASVFRTIAEEVSAKMTELLTVEGRQIPEYRYQPDKFVEGDHDVRVRWLQPQGSIVEDPKVGAVKNPSDAAQPVTPIYIRRADVHVWMQHATDEDVEHLLETLIRASKRTEWDRYFHWGLAKYDYPSQAIGQEVRNGASVIRLTVPLDIQVSAEIDNEYQLREVTADKLQAGIVANLTDDLDPADRAVAEWNG
jgi:hypothetical protein